VLPAAPCYAVYVLLTSNYFLLTTMPTMLRHATYSLLLTTPYAYATNTNNLQIANTNHDNY
jgi:hypothetical protein